MASANQPTSLPESAARKIPTGAEGNEGRSALPELGHSVKLNLSASKGTGLALENPLLAYRISLRFDRIKLEMEKSLACELAEFLPKACEQSWLPKAKSPTEHECYRTLLGIERNRKELYYPHWFFLATRWGPDHPSLQPIRKDMETLWGVEFPTSSISYPTNIPVEHQKTLFYRNPMEPTPLCEMKKQVQGFKAAIEDVNKPSIIEAVTEYAPALLNRAVQNGGAELLEKNLKDTQEQLQRTREELNNTQEELRETRTQLLESQKKLKEDIKSSNGDLATMNRRVDKVVDTCALVLSILNAPRGEKRKHEPEQDGA